MADEPVLVHVLGPIHGVLFLLYVAAVFVAASVLKWRWQRIVAGIIASVVPFGTFILEARLRREYAGHESSIEN